MGITCHNRIIHHNGVIGKTASAVKGSKDYGD